MPAAMRPGSGSAQGMKDKRRGAADRARRPACRASAHGPARSKTRAATSALQRRRPHRRCRPSRGQAVAHQPPALRDQRGLRLRFDMHARAAAISAAISASSSLCSTRRKHLCLVERQRLGRRACQQNRTHVLSVFRSAAMSRVPFRHDCSGCLLLAAPALAVTGNAPPAAAMGGAADRDDRRCARRPLHRHGARARSGAHGRALRAPAGRLHDQALPDRRADCRCARSCAIRDSTTRAMPPAAPPPTSPCSSSPRRCRTSCPGNAGGAAARRRRRDAHHCRLRRHTGGDRARAWPAAHGDADRDRQARLAADPALRHRPRATSASALAAAPAIPARRPSMATARWSSAW